jgi:hypothetical protein
LGDATAWLVGWGVVAAAVSPWWVAAVKRRPASWHRLAIARVDQACPTAETAMVWRRGSTRGSRCKEPDGAVCVLSSQRAGDSVPFVASSPRG